MQLEAGSRDQADARSRWAGKGGWRAGGRSKRLEEGRGASTELVGHALMGQKKRFGIGK